MRCDCGRIRMSFSSTTTCRKEEQVHMRAICEEHFLTSKMEKTLDFIGGTRAVNNS